MATEDLHPQLDPTHLAVFRCPPGWQPPTLPSEGFVAVVAGEHEVTVVGPESLLDDPSWAGAAEQVDAGWRRITFPGPLPWELVGFLAEVAGRLAGAQIPFTSMSGFTTDHVLVRAAQADLAVTVLSGSPPPPQRPGTNP
ncbi:MAG TPA: ACT domain-containing protein [Mycobacteriales bacterium]|nr:ACT domain-containing protein [Mycobacteriales bacterium]